MKPPKGAVEAASNAEDPRSEQSSQGAGDSSDAHPGGSRALETLRKLDKYASPAIVTLICAAAPSALFGADSAWEYYDGTEYENVAAPSLGAAGQALLAGGLAASGAVVTYIRSKRKRPEENAEEEGSESESDKR